MFWRPCRCPKRQVLWYGGSMQIIIFIGFSVLPFQITDRFGISKYIANLKHRVRKRIGCGYTRGEDTAGEGNSGSSSRRRPLAPQRGYEELGK